MLTRTRLSVIPSRALRSSGTDRCVIAAGWLASVSVPPRLAAGLAMRSVGGSGRSRELLDLYVALMLTGLCQFIGSLHPQQRVGLDPKGLFEPDSHIG